jgi:hypothetical protein
VRAVATVAVARKRDWQEHPSGKARFVSDMVVINDPEYAGYKLKKTFADNWAASETR